MTAIMYKPDADTLADFEAWARAPERAAIAHAIAKGVVVVASAGNNGTASGFAPYVYPAAFPGVISVGAVSPAGTRAPSFDGERQTSRVDMGSLDRRRPSDHPGRGLLG